MYDLAEGFTPVTGSAALAVTEALLALLATGDPVKSPAAQYTEHDMRNDTSCRTSLADTTQSVQCCYVSKWQHSNACGCSAILHSFVLLTLLG